MKNSYHNVKCYSYQNCMCYTCEVNRVKSVCLGCSKCAEHDQILPTKDCDKQIKYGDWSGFYALYLKGKCYIIVPSGICDVPTPYPMTQSEFENFELWKNDYKTMIDIQNNARNKK